MVEIKSYPAKNGDAFLVKASSSLFAMLVDGGYAETFRRHIKPDLHDLAANGYVLDVVVATHVDADHISGLLAFFRMNGTAQEPVLISVREVLYNSLRSLIPRTASYATMRQDDLELLREIRLRGYRQPDLGGSPEQEISARQGSCLSQVLREGGYKWNICAGETPIGGDGILDFSFTQGRISILGPNKARLDALKKWWMSEMRRLGWIGDLNDHDDAFEFMCSHEVADPGEQTLACSDTNLAAAYVPDNSVTNGSSISFILEIEGCRLLFLGDSWADDTTDALAAYGLSFFDAVKIAHHGSVRNTSVELLKLVDSPHFFISTNGEGHNHPDFAVLKAIVDRPVAFCRTLHFNYSTPASRKLKTYQSKTGANFVINEEETGWVTINCADAK